MDWRGRRREMPRYSRVEISVRPAEPQGASLGQVLFGEEGHGVCGCLSAVSTTGRRLPMAVQNGSVRLHAVDNIANRALRAAPPASAAGALIRVVREAGRPRRRRSIRLPSMPRIESSVLGKRQHPRSVLSVRARRYCSHLSSAADLHQYITHPPAPAFPALAFAR